VIVGRLGDGSSANRVVRQSQAKSIIVQPAERGCAFMFTAKRADCPGARVTARFTDAAGLHWQIGPDLHLEQLDNRDNW
jgi:hypothetical protein